MRTCNVSGVEELSSAAQLSSQVREPLQVISVSLDEDLKRAWIAKD